jgi:hypothetical protein
MGIEIEHYIILYSDIVDLVDICINYCKSALSSNEIILILSHYEPAAKIFELLKKNVKFIEPYKADGSLVIVDSKRACFNNKNEFVGITIMLKMLLTRRVKLSKNGIRVIADMGNFFHPLLRIQDLVRHEGEISSLEEFPVRFYCSYASIDLGSVTNEQEQGLIQKHDRFIKL